MAGAGIGAAVLCGLVLSIPALRVTHFYLGMTTLLLALLVPIVGSQLSITGGVVGISLIGNPGFRQHPSGTALYEIGVVMVALCLAGFALIYRSPLGNAFRVMKQSDDLA